MKYILIIFFALLIFLIYKNTTIENYQDYKTSIDKIYCINIEESKDRWDTIRKNAKKEGLKINRFNAVNGKIHDLNDLEEIHKIKINKKLKKGTVGCALSHILALRRIKSENNDHVLIIEDDIKITPRLNQKINSYLKEIDFDFDIIFLGGCNIYGESYKEKFIKPVNIKQKKRYRHNLCCHAMLIKKKNVDKILEALKSIDRSIDTQLRENFGFLNCFYCNPPLIYQNREISSDLQSINNKTINKPNNYKNINNVTII